MLPRDMACKAARVTLSMSVTLAACAAIAGSLGAAAGVTVMSECLQSSDQTAECALRLAGFIAAAVSSDSNAAMSSYRPAIPAMERLWMVLELAETSCIGPERVILLSAPPARKPPNVIFVMGGGRSSGICWLLRSIIQPSVSGFRW